LFFYSGDRDEPPHVHVEREDNTAEFWIDPVRIDRSRGFGRTELLRVHRLAGANAELLLRFWDEYFKD
jgi:Domain of unknown function (DUF4160)